MHNSNRLSDLPSTRELENFLRERISESHSSPFIAHYEVPSEQEESVRNEIVNHIDGHFFQFLKLMKSFPCVSVRLIATALRDSYGAEGSSKVYPLIAEHLGLRDTIISPKHQEKLIKIFRSCCWRVGLTLPEVKRRVHCYLFQAGISHHQLWVLAETFLKAEYLLGMPNPNSTKDLDDWEDRAIDLAPKSHPVLQLPVRNDPTAYHAIIFAHLRTPNVSPRSQFEIKFLEAIKSQLESSRHDRKDSAPVIEFSDGELRVTLPQRAHRVEIKINDHIHPLSPGRQLGLLLPWPTYIQWRCYGSDKSDWKTIGTLSDEQYIYIFDGETGRYKKFINPRLPSRQSVQSGQLCLISKTKFEVNEYSSHRLDDKAFVLFCNVSSEMVIQQCGRSIKVGIEERLRLEVVGKQIVRNQKGWLLAGSISVRVHGQKTENSDLLVVKLRHPAISGETEFSVTKEQISKLNMPKSGNFGLASISLHIRGQNRVLYRANFWYWPSLMGLRDGRLFNASSIPDNLAKDRLLHIHANSRGQLKINEGESYLRARLCFRVGRELVSFSLPPPGASLSVRRPDGSEQALKVGDTLLVRDNYASNLIVRYSDPKAQIDLKGEILTSPFGKIGMWTISFAALRQKGEHNKVCLLPSSKLPQDLVQIALYIDPSYFKVQQYADVWVADAEFENPIDAVQIRAKNLITGEKLEGEVTLRPQSDNPNRLEESTLLRVFPRNSSNRLVIEIPHNNYMDGIWFLHLHVREHGDKEWIPIINGSGESYAIYVAPDNFIQKLASDDSSIWNSVIQQSEAFIRLSEALETPIAKECRQNMKRLGLKAWILLGKLLAARFPDDQASLLKACALPRSIHAPESWIPLYHPIEIAPELFKIPSEDIAILASNELPEYECFEFVGLAETIESLKETVDDLGISVKFLLGFENGSEIIQGNSDASPGSFDFTRYCNACNAVTQEQWIDDSDNLLSIFHHDQACYRMADRIELAEKNNSLKKRIESVTRIVHYAPSGLNYKNLNIPDDLENFSLVEKSPRLMATLTESWRKGNAEKYWNDLASKANLPPKEVRKHVGFILRLAPELLAFYLLLWVLVEKHERE